MKTVCMIGGGSWGTAVSTVLAHKGYAVNLWCYEPEVAQTINTQHVNERYLPGVTLSPHIRATNDMAVALSGAQVVLQAVPVKFLRTTLAQAAPHKTAGQTWIVLSKGIEQDSLALPHDMVTEVIGSDVSVAVVAGPSFAQEVADQVVTGVTVAAAEREVACAVQELLVTDYFRPFTSLDVIGVATGAALKNVVTLAVGIADGAGCAQNTKAFLLTRGLSEIVSVALHLGGVQQTLYGLSGVGDLVLTAMGTKSRNLAVGRLVGKGEKLADILAQTGYIPEGVNTVQSMHQLMEKFGLNLPIVRGVYDVLFGGRSIDEFITLLTTSSPQDECR